MQAVYPEQWFGVRERVARGIARVRRDKRSYQIRVSYADQDGYHKELSAEARLDHVSLKQLVSSSPNALDTPVSIPIVAELYSAGFDEYFILLRFIHVTEREAVPFALIQSPSVLL